MLKWNEADFVEYLGVQPDVIQPNSFLGYSVSKDGLRLGITFMPDRDIVYFTLFRDGVDQPVMSTGFLRCEHAEYVRPNERELGHLEFVVSESDAPSLGANTGSLKRVKITVEPHIQVGFESRG
jgi:hypothetical protein